ncbi:hypothetical protein GGR57DRAFT_452445 [Xylariaceae sp. FL1272]|nr:hypothetical protein GGR57DRAFT_452445 [Xylariaceae sp. FL1272]
MATFNSVTEENGKLLALLCGSQDVQHYYDRVVAQRHNVEPLLEPTDLPSQEEKENDAMAILRGMIDQRFTRRAEAPQAGDALYGNDRPNHRVKPRYPLEALKAVAWQLVDGVVAATVGLCIFSPFESAKFPVYQQLAGYRPRLVILLNALKVDKGLVKQCFDNRSFPAKLTWDLRGRLSVSLR